MRRLSPCLLRLPEDAPLPAGWFAEGSVVVHGASGTRLRFLPTSYREDRPTLREVSRRIQRALAAVRRGMMIPAPAQPDLALCLGALLLPHAGEYRERLRSEAAGASRRGRRAINRRMHDLDRAMEAHRRRMLAFEAAERSPSAPPGDRGCRHPRPQPTGRRAPALRRASRWPVTSGRRASAAPAPTTAPAEAPGPDAAAIPPRLPEGGVRRHRVARLLLVAIASAVILLIAAPGDVATHEDRSRAGNAPEARAQTPARKEKPSWPSATA